MYKSFTMRALLALLFTAYSLLAFAESQEYGLASVYAATFQGKRTASGEIFNHNVLTAAHQKYPFGTLVRVTRMDNGKSVIVRIIDRGPFVSQRVTELSKAAAIRLGVNNEKEEVRVKIEVVNNRNVELTQSKERNTSSPRETPNSNEQPRSTPSSAKAEVNAKSVEQQAVLKEYRYQPSKNSLAQKKNLR
jgi:rare lipoprotein A